MPMLQLRPLLALTRFDKPIGIWLLYFPAAWAVALTAAPVNLLHFLWLMLLGAAVMRAAGCVVNDLTDRKLDGQVARTRSRPLACGRVPRWQAYLLLVGLLFIALALALSLPPTVFTLALLALPMIAAYPWMKRITGWPQLFLGLTFNLSALIGWAATGTPLTLPAFTLYAAAIFWTLGYDTIYAVQDMADDEKIGIRSSARAVGPGLKKFITFCYSAMILLLAVTGMVMGCGIAYDLGIALAALHATYQIRQLPPTPEQAGAIFRSNQWLGLVVLVGMVVDRVV